MSTPSLVTAVAAIRAECAFVKKTARNTGINSDYASYLDVVEVLKPLLTRHGVAIGFLPSKIRSDAVRESGAWVQEMIMVVSHGSETETVTFETLFPEKNRGTNLTQCQGMAQTYGKRYALVNYFHLITGDDDDAVRLGLQPEDDAAPAAPADTHWSALCHVPLAGIGTEESFKAWTALADPSDYGGQRTLGDCTDQALANAWVKHPKDAGLNAWRAELIQSRAAARQLPDWSSLHRMYPKLNLPETMQECSGDDLRNLSLELASKK